MSIIQLWTLYNLYTLEVTLDWRTVLAPTTELLAYISRKLDLETAPVLPEHHLVFAALEATPLETVRVVILGQDPYPTPGHAHGLAFSVRPGYPKARGLVNLLKEYSDDLGYPVPDNGYLLPWAKQGVLLLNTVLTVRAHEPNSHAHLGWLEFTDIIIRSVVAYAQPSVFILWGKQAWQRRDFIVSPHKVLQSMHPSPHTAHKGFFGSKPFTKANLLLQSLGREPIDWRLPNLSEET